MSYVDTANFGRCYTFKPTEQMIKKGIKQIVLKVLKSLQIFFHTNGIFETKIYSSGHRLVSQLLGGSEQLCFGYRANWVLKFGYWMWMGIGYLNIRYYTK